MSTIQILGNDHRYIEGPDGKIWAPHFRDDSIGHLYTGDSDNGLTYGRLYNKSRIATLKPLIAEEGWRIPTMAEFDAFLVAMGTTRAPFPFSASADDPAIETLFMPNAGVKLREVGTSHWVDWGFEGIDSFGVGLVGSGVRAGGSDYGRDETCRIVVDTYSSGMAVMYFVVYSQESCQRVAHTWDDDSDFATLFLVRDSLPTPPVEVNMTKKTFILCDDSTGLPVAGKFLRLKDVDGVLTDIDMIPLGAGAYRAEVPNGAWRVFDVTAGGTGTDTGHILESLAYLTREPPLGSGTAGQFLADGKVWRLIEIEDVSGLQAALDDVADTAASSLADEAVARSGGDADLQAAIDAITLPAPVALTAQWVDSSAGVPVDATHSVVAYSTRGSRVIVGRIQLASKPVGAGTHVFLRLNGPNGFTSGEMSDFVGTWHAPLTGVNPGDWSGSLFPSWTEDRIDFAPIHKDYSGVRNGVRWEEFVAVNSNTMIFRIEVPRAA